MSVDEQVLRAVHDAADELATVRLPPSLAKLYSQHTRLREAQEGLRGWRPGEEALRFDDALRLLQAGLIARDEGLPEWRSLLRRAAEVLEWLAHPELNTDVYPVATVAAAAYQLGGYSARARSLLADDPAQDEQSAVLRTLLAADLADVQQQIALYWADRLERREGDAPTAHEIMTERVMRAVGVVVARLRWGGYGSRAAAAVNVLDDIASFCARAGDAVSWLLAALTKDVIEVYYERALRTQALPLRRGMSDRGREALDKYFALSFQDGRSITWPSQSRGIAKLTETRESFVLATPTGSGKTTVAELAVLQGMFGVDDDAESAPLALYMTPSRALAGEVESKLSRMMRSLRAEEVAVTGLYGGADWGPNDAWLSRTQPTVLVCTYEKAEALLRFLGPLFVDRLSTIVIDEGHKIYYDGQRKGLIDGNNRSLRLESLAMRLMEAVNGRAVRLVLMSAVTGDPDDLGRWLRLGEQPNVASSSFRSTRQLIGRLICQPNGTFSIRYDLLDGASLQFVEEGETSSPFIPTPFGAHPPAPAWEDEGPEKRLRPPLLWAAMQLGSPTATGSRRSVLISVMQWINGYADDFLKLLDDVWAGEDVPRYFDPPTAGSDDEAVYRECLASCEDYFGLESREYRLLEKGIALHHGQMPGLLSRLIVELIERRIVQVVLATSTLSEGINLPFETILIPSIRRAGSVITREEFGNLVGRAGRPGFGTEGRALVLLPGPRHSYRAAWNAYGDLYTQFVGATAAEGPKRAESPLATLLATIEDLWIEVSGQSDPQRFMRWLEQTAPTLVEEPDDAVEALDSLDAIILAAITELEMVKQASLTAAETEEQLAHVWQRTYARYASDDEARLQRIFLTRGRSVPERIYPDPALRRRLYRTGVPPRTGTHVLDLYRTLVEHLRSGFDYATWEAPARADFVIAAARVVREVPRFKKKDKQNGVGWDDVLHWWLDADSASRGPTVRQTSDWIDFVQGEFGYRFAWGLGTALGIAVDDAFGAQLRPLELDDWGELQLPWIALWMKDLVLWGTSDPVAASLLSRRRMTTRNEASAAADRYYSEKHDLDATPNDLLDPRRVSEWIDREYPSGTRTARRRSVSRRVRVDLVGGVNATNRLVKVLPVEHGDRITWIDVAGYPLATSDVPRIWRRDAISTHTFRLAPQRREVRATRDV